MVISHLSGGIGNQMFQFATGYSVARRVKTDLVLNLSAYMNNIRSYELDNFEKVQDFCHYDFAKPARKKSLNLLRKYFSWGDEYVERHPFKYSNSINSCRDGVNLYGYFQSEKYFSLYRNELLEFFDFKVCKDLEFNKVLQLIQPNSSVSLHIRRGDYFSNSATKAYHGILPIEYYKKAVEIVSSLILNPVYFIFSDDMEWAKNNLNFLTDPIFVNCNRGGNSFRDIQLMSLCHSNIIANSSFSWWGAWLNKNKQKIVVAPKKWVAIKREPIDDIVPSNWIKI